MLGSARGRWCNPTGLLTRDNDDDDISSSLPALLKFGIDRQVDQTLAYDGRFIL